MTDIFIFYKSPHPLFFTSPLPPVRWLGYHSIGMLFTWTLHGISCIKLNFQNTEQKYFLSFFFRECAVVLSHCEHSADPHILSHCRTTYREMVPSFDKISQTPVFCCLLQFCDSKEKLKECTGDLLVCVFVIPEVLDQTSGLHFNIQHC